MRAVPNLTLDALEHAQPVPGKWPDPPLIDTARAEAKSLVRALDYELAQELPEEPEFADEIVEGLIGRGAMSVLYGDSNSGKTFLAIDMAAAIALGQKWMSRHVEPVLVVYLATEGPTSVRERLKAYQQRHGCKVPNFVIVKTSINLFDGEADTTAVIALVHEMESLHGLNCGLIVGDTLARLSAGANENSGEDMGVVVQHVDRIRAETGAHFMLIHHSGKDAARGMRGWSGLRAATDTEVEVTSDELVGVRTAEVTKQRDIGGKGDRIGFRLQVVDMGIGKWGKPRTSCVVLPADAPTKQERGKRPSEIAGAIAELLRERRTGMHKGEVVKHFAGTYDKSAVYRELRKMSEAGRLAETAGIVALLSGG